MTFSHFDTVRECGVYTEKTEERTEPYTTASTTTESILLIPMRHNYV